jgi:hypothetical protein
LHQRRSTPGVSEENQGCWTQRESTPLAAADWSIMAKTVLPELVIALLRAATVSG